jgi:hypothetical protein
MKTAKSPEILFLIIVALAAAATAVLITDAVTQDRAADRAASFQHLVGGLGFGPALDLSSCSCSFDPRLRHTCALDFGPIPGGHCFCLPHVASIFSYPELPSVAEKDTKEVPHVDRP